MHEQCGAAVILYSITLINRCCDLQGEKLLIVNIFHVHLYKKIRFSYNRVLH